MGKVVGKIFKKDEADKLYGKVLKSVKIETSNTKAILKNAGEYVMFKFEGDNLIIFSDRNKTIHGTYTTKASDVLYVYSKSKVEEVMKEGAESETYFEQRKEVFTVTNGGYTLELVDRCPPFC